MDERYIVTGAAGHLGSAVVRKLEEYGKAIDALCLPNEEHLPRGNNVTVYKVDVRDIGSLAEAFGRHDGEGTTVIHCAGIVSISSRYDRQIYNVNVTGTKNIIGLCEKHQVKRLVYISSVHAIPEPPVNETIKEIRRFTPDDVVGMYAKTKAEATQYVLDYAARGYDACIVHPSGIVGPGDFGRGHITQLVIDFYKGRLLGGVGGGYDFVDVRDVADGVVACCERGRSGECYILSGSYTGIPDLLEMLHKVTGKKRVRLTLPLWFARLAAPLTEVYYRFLKQPPLYTSYSLYTLNTNACFSHQKASEELGYAPRPMEVTLIDTVKWLKENGRL